MKKAKRTDSFESVLFLWRILRREIYPTPLFTPPKSARNRSIVWTKAAVFASVVVRTTLAAEIVANVRSIKDAQTDVSKKCVFHICTQTKSNFISKAFFSFMNPENT